MSGIISISGLWPATYPYYGACMRLHSFRRRWSKRKPIISIVTYLNKEPVIGDDEAQQDDGTDADKWLECVRIEGLLQRSTFHTLIVVIVVVKTFQARLLHASSDRGPVSDRM